MKLLESLFDINNEVLTICDIKFGGSYDDWYDAISCLQDKRTGDFRVDYLLEDYGVFVDFDSDDNYCINKIILTYYPGTPLEAKALDDACAFFMLKLNITHWTKEFEEYSEDPYEFGYSISLSSSQYDILIKGDTYCDKVSIIITKP